MKDPLNEEHEIVKLYFDSSVILIHLRKVVRTLYDIFYTL